MIFACIWEVILSRAVVRTGNSRVDLRNIMPEARFGGCPVPHSIGVPSSTRSLQANICRASDNGAPLVKALKRAYVQEFATHRRQNGAQFDRWMDQVF
ncbi:MAG: hypothetical protein ACJARE_003368 [Paracoccaceae bacterium]|jgi:hypothetical protein